MINQSELAIIPICVCGLVTWKACVRGIKHTYTHNASFEVVIGSVCVLLSAVDSPHDPGVPGWGRGGRTLLRSEV